MVRLKTGILAFSVVGVCFSAPVWAQEVLSEDWIEDFYNRAAEVQLSGKQDAVDFFEKHMHPNGQMVLNIITKIKGVQDQKQKVTYNKREMLKATKAGYDSSTMHSIEGSVLSVKISVDGRSAKVKDSTFGTATVRLPTPQGLVEMGSDQAMLCDDEILLNEDGIIQISKSVCNVEVTMKPIR